MTVDEEENEDEVSQEDVPHLPVGEHQVPTSLITLNGRQALQNQMV